MGGNSDECEEELRFSPLADAGMAQMHIGCHGDLE